MNYSILNLNLTFLPLNFKKALIYKGFTDKDFICKKTPKLVLYCFKNAVKSRSFPSTRYSVRYCKKRKKI